MKNQNNLILEHMIKQAKKAVRFQNIELANSAFHNILIVQPNNIFALRGIKKLEKINLNPGGNIIKNIKKLFLNNNYIECENECIKLLKLDKKRKEFFLYLGLSLFRQNKFSAAIENYERALDIFNNDIDITFNLGNAYKGNIEYKKAINKYKAVIVFDDQYLPALINIAELYNRINRHQISYDYSIKAIKLDFKSDKALCNLGNSLLGMNKLEEALKVYEDGLKYNKNSKIIIHNKAITLMKLEKNLEAKKTFENGFKYNNINNSSLIDYGLCLFKLGELEQSLNIYKKALALLPNNYELHNNLGNLYSHMGEYTKALIEFINAKKLIPNSKEIYFNIALNFFHQNLYDKGIENCLISIKLDQKFYQAYDLLGSCYQNKDMINEAVNCFEIAIKLAPYFYTSLFNLGNLCIKNGRIHEAITLFEKAKELNCPFFELEYLISTAKFNSLNGVTEHFDELMKSFEKNKYNPIFISSYLLPLLYSDKINNQELFKLHQKFDTSEEIIKVKKNTHKKIKVGYVSADFTSHSVGYFIEPLIKNHNQENFEIFIYFNNNPDNRTKIFQSYCKNWRNIFGKSDEYVFNLIKNDAVDVLVDLSGHTRGNRLEVFRRKPAYKQISWLGYPYTTGLKTIDYKFTDKTVDPIGKSEMIHTEKLYRIPDSFLCYQNNNYVHINKKKPFQDNNFITFGSFNNIQKITQNNLLTWIKILQSLPKSRLVLKSIQYSTDSVITKFLNIFEENNISKERIKLLPMIPSVHGHLAMYNKIDIALDTFPYNGATTTMESLWMGVPVITITGENHASRVGTSILKNLNLKNLIAKDEKEYIKLSIELSKDINLLNYYQNNLRDIMKKSVLLDGKSFAIKIEQAFEKIFSED